MIKQSIIRAVRGIDTWAVVEWRGVAANAERWIKYCADNPEEFFRGDKNAPPEHAKRGEIWEWRGVLADSESDLVDVGEWGLVGMIPAIEEPSE